MGRTHAIGCCLLLLTGAGTRTPAGPPSAPATPQVPAALVAPAPGTTPAPAPAAKVPAAKTTAAKAPAAQTTAASAAASHPKPAPRPGAQAKAAQPVTASGRASHAACGAFGRPAPLGALPKSIREASGLVVSQRDPTVIWVHNDGHQGRIFGVSAAHGTLVAEVKLKKLRPKARDWEELSDGPCGTARVGAATAGNATAGNATAERRCLVVGDTGDNGRDREAIVFHRLAEPDPRGGKQVIKQYETLIARYPNGKRYDSEAFVMDDAGIIWLWTKADKHTHLFRVPFVAGQARLEHVAKVATAAAMHVPAGRGTRLTAAAWDANTGRLLLRSYDAGWELCVGRAGLAAMPRATWHRIALVDELQGEAIAVGGGGLYHVSEGKRARVYRLLRR